MTTLKQVISATKELCLKCRFNWQGFCEHPETNRYDIRITTSQVSCSFRYGAIEDDFNSIKFCNLKEN